MLIRCRGCATRASRLRALLPLHPVQASARSARTERRPSTFPAASPAAAAGLAGLGAESTVPLLLLQGGGLAGLSLGAELSAPLLLQCLTMPAGCPVPTYTQLTNLSAQGLQPTTRLPVPFCVSGAVRCFFLLVISQLTRWLSRSRQAGQSGYGGTQDRAQAKSRGKARGGAGKGRGEV